MQTGLFFSEVPFLPERREVSSAIFLFASKKAEGSEEMELTREGFKTLDSKQVREFLLAEGVLDDEDAEKLVKSKVKGATLLRSSMEDIIKYGLPAGAAKDLILMLEDKFPGASLVSVLVVHVFKVTCSVLIFVCDLSWLCFPE